MPTENQAAEIKVNRVPYWAGYAIAVFGILMAVYLFREEPGQGKTAPVIYFILFYSALLLLIGSLLSFLFFTLHRQQRTEEQYLGWQIMKWKEEQEKERTSNRSTEAAEKLKLEKEQQNTEKAEKQRLQAEQQVISLYFKLLELSKGDWEELDKLTEHYKAFVNTQNQNKT